jgi:hypothetical protein
MAFSPGRHALSGRGAGERGVLCGCRTLRGRRLQPPEHRRFGEEPCATHLPPGQVAALEGSYTMSAETVRHWAVRWSSAPRGSVSRVSSVDACVIVME